MNALLAALLLALSPAPRTAQFDALPDCYEMVPNCAYRVDGTVVKGFIHRGRYVYVWENGTVRRERSWLR